MVNKFRSKVFHNLILMRIITRSRGLIKEVVTLYLRFFRFVTCLNPTALLIRLVQSLD